MTDGLRSLFSAAILGVCLLVGLAAGGYLIGNGAARFRAESRIVTVKGLVEREVKADQATWRLGLRRAGEDLPDAQARLSADRDATVAFLRKQGFTDEEIGREPVRALDKRARDFDQPQGADRLRYVVTTLLIVKTDKVDLVRASLSATEELLKAGVALDGDRAVRVRFWGTGREDPLRQSGDDPDLRSRRCGRIRPLQPDELPREADPRGQHLRVRPAVGRRGAARP